jgi:hypothetical protein
MTVQKKVILSNVILAVLVTAILAFKTDTFPGNGFFFMLGVIGIAGGLGCLGLGLLLLLRKDKQAAKGYLISAALLLAIGLVSYFLLHQY